METFHEMTIAGLKRQLPLCRVNEHLRIAAFVIFGDVELTVAAATELLKKTPEFDVIVTAEAKVKAKRIAVHHSAHQQSMNGVPLMAKSHHTTYYATFGLEGDRRLELQVSQGQFQQLTEGEQGKLTYQRKRFHRFEGENA